MPHCRGSAVLKSVGLIYHRRKVHGAFATDCLSLIKLPKTCHTLPVLSIIITSRPLKKGPLLQQSQSVFIRVNPRLMWNIPFHWWGKPQPTELLRLPSWHIWTSRSFARCLLDQRWFHYAIRTTQYAVRVRNPR